MNCKPLFTAMLIMSLSACQNQQENKETNNQKNFNKGTFGYDLDFLKQHDSVIVLSNADDSAQVIVSAKYQGKVFTSTAAGNGGLSFGWINYNAFTAPVDAHMNAYGGENRLWLGPEGGKYSLFFPKGKTMVFENWKTPAPIDIEAWEVSNKSDKGVTMKKDMQVTNYAGTPLSISVERSVSILDRKAIAANINMQPGANVKAVAYTTDNKITNTGNQAWNETTGMPCIWILDMLMPSPSTVIAIPYETTGVKEGDKIATTDYFGEIPADRIKYQKGVLFFKADGKSRGKLGLGPARAKPIVGSYDAENKVLTITMFDVDKNGKYLNQEWNTNKPPFSGDAVNAYNDGPLEDGKQMGPFYEIESVSPAAFLSPKQSLSHKHTVFHFTGDKAQLDPITLKLLGISLRQIEDAF